MGGIVFFRTKMLKKLVDFYVNRVGMRVWLEQTDCTILQHGGLLVGFCQRELAESEGMLTFFYSTVEEVDEMFTALRDISTTHPCVNEKYGIYQFLATDPEGRIIEFQNFMHPIDYKF
ncbi:MAG: VOC family protein [Candidatus Thorarchaeota archaeon]